MRVTYVEDRVFVWSGRPNCALCKKPVERIETEVLRDYSPGVQFTAWCHGERDSVVLSDYELWTLAANGLRFGDAFVRHAALARMNDDERKGAE